MDSQTPARTPTGTRAQTRTQHSYLIMQTPTTAQLRTAIEVLNKLGDASTRTPTIRFSSCRIQNSAAITRRRSSHKQSSRPRNSQSLSRSWSVGVRKCSSKGGSVFLIMLKTGHALPLVVTRILRPRSSRGESADCPREVCGLWPRTRKIRDLDSGGDRPRTETIHVHELSVSAFSPRQQLCPWTIRVRAQATDSIVRGQAAAVDADCPQTVRSRELSTTANRSRTQSVRERGLEGNCPRRCIAVSILPPVHFLIHVRIIPSHAFV